MSGITGRENMTPMRPYSSYQVAALGGALAPGRSQANPYLEWGNRDDLPIVH